MITRIWQSSFVILLVIGFGFVTFNSQINAQQGPPSSPPGCPAICPDPCPACPAGGGGFPADGTDMWIAAMADLGTFTPHNNSCDNVTEAFVQITSDGKGFCIEKNERSAERWDLARHNCLQDNKRLPEPTEWRFACRDAVNLSINDILGANEWVTNFIHEVGVVIQGIENCDDVIPTAVSSNSPTLLGFRCVR